MNRKVVAQELVKVAKELLGGATDFYSFGSGGNASAVFKSLVSEAKHERGQGGYTGTIAEKNGFVVVGKAKDRKEAIGMAHAQVLDNDRWGPAFCIEVSSPKGFLFFGMASE
jgi:hypothetical protein